MTEVTDFQIQQDGVSVIVVLDGKVGRMLRATDLADDTAINRFKEDFEQTKALVAAARKRHLETNLVQFPGSTSAKRPLGLAALGDDHVG